VPNTITSLHVPSISNWSKSWQLSDPTGHAANRNRPNNFGGGNADSSLLPLVLSRLPRLAHLSVSLALPGPDPALSTLVLLVPAFPLLKSLSITCGCLHATADHLLPTLIRAMAPTLTSFGITLPPHIIPLEVIAETSRALASAPNLTNSHIAVNMYQCLSTHTGWSRVPHLTSLTLGVIPELVPSAVLLVHLKMWKRLHTLTIHDLSAASLDTLLGVLHDRVRSVTVTSAKKDRGLLMADNDGDDDDRCCRARPHFLPCTSLHGGISVAGVRAAVLRRFPDCRSCTSSAVSLNTESASASSHDNVLNIRLRRP
jgi:hypothetical protein